MLNLNKYSVRFQLQLTVSICFIIAFLTVGLMVYKGAYQVLLDNTLQEHESKVEGLAQSLSGEFDALLESAEKLEASFQNGYLFNIQQSEKTVTLAGESYLDLTINGQSLSENNSLSDRFYKDTGAVATVFAATQGDFLRISTSLKDKQGQRTVGTLLGTQHPGYAQLKRGQAYHAKVNLFGTEYITYYSPIVQNNGELIGLSFIGLPVDDATHSAFKKLKNITWGDSGYTIIVDNAEANKGHYLLHPTLKGNRQNIQDYTSADGQKPLQAIFTSDEGTITYQDNSQNNNKEKYLVFANVEGWNWKIAGGTYISEVTKASHDLVYTILLTSLIIGGFAFAIVSWLLTRMTRPLKTISSYMDRLGKGEVSISIEKKGSDNKNEISRLSNTMGDMANQLSSLVEKIRETSDGVFDQASGVARDSQQSLLQSETQQERVEQAVSAIEEMAMSAKAVAEQVENIACNVRDASNSSQQGQAVVSNVSNDMTALNGLLDQSADAISSVAKNSESIQDVTRMIDEIAEQTNLLALNAAIEAARAGDQGRGFAVVADEVRTLAQRTQSSVKEVVTIISQLQDSTSGAVALILSSQKNANHVLTQTADAGLALSSITQQITDIASQSEAIAATSEEQAHVSQEIAASIADISQLNEKNREVTADTATSAANLQTQATELKQQVGFFH